VSPIHEAALFRGDFFLVLYGLVEITSQATALFVGPCALYFAATESACDVPAVFTAVSDRISLTPNSSW
jgi:hypothetical protein